MKRLISLVTVCVLALSTAACGKEKVSGDTSQPETAAVQTNTEVTSTTEIPTTTTTTTTAPIMPPMSQPVECFKGSEGRYYLANIWEGADNTVLIKNNNFDTSEYIVFDPVTDRVIRKIEPGDIGDELLGMFSDGTIVTTSATKNGVLLMYPKDSDIPREVDLGIDYYTSMHLDRVNDCIYYKTAPGEGIIKVDKNGYKSVQVSGKDLLYNYEIYPESMTFYASAGSEKTKSGAQSGIFSIMTGRLLAELPNDVSIQGFAKDKLLGITFSESDSDGAFETHLHLISMKNDDYTVYRLSKNDFGSANIFSSPYTDKIIAASFSTGMNGSVQSLHMIDAATGKMADVDVEIGSDATYIYACYLEEVERWIVALTKFDYSTGCYSYDLFMIDPEMLTYDKQLEQGEKAKTETYEPVPVGAGYENIRRRADEIEKKFGVKVYVGNEVKNVEESSQYVLVSTEGVEYYGEEAILGFLDGLEDLLGMYPKGFFEHFKSDSGTCGLRISLVEELKNDSYSSFTAGGVAFMTGGWYDIAIAIGSMHKTTTSLHHEIWHCVEDLVGRRYGWIDATEWEKLNPEGFSFTNDFDGYATNYGNIPYKTLMDVLWEEDKDYNSIYFISNYSITTAMEDRATLIEQLFQCDYSQDPVDEDYPRLGPVTMRDYPHLAAKLDYLKNWIKSEFAYVYWEEMFK